MTDAENKKLIEDANNYFKWCEENGKRLTFSGLQIYLNIGRSALKYLTNEVRKIRMGYEDLLLDKQYNVYARFILKNT